MIRLAHGEESHARFEVDCIVLISTLDGYTEIVNLFAVSCRRAGDQDQRQLLYRLFHQNGQLTRRPRRAKVEDERGS